MRKAAFYAAAAAMVMAGTTTVTSQAAVKTYVGSGSCGGLSGGNQGGCNNNSFDSNCGNGGQLYSGNNSLAGQTLQGILSSNSGSGCFGSNSFDLWDYLGGGSSCTPAFGNGNCGIWNGSCDILNSGNNNCVIWNPGSGDCTIQNPGSGDCPVQNPGTGDWGNGNDSSGNPDNGNSGTPGQTPGQGNQGGSGQNPGVSNPGSQDSYIQQVIDLVNEERTKAGLSPVTEVSEVSAAAAVRAQEITSNFSHTRPNGTYYNTVLDQNGVSYRGSGENIAYGQQTPAAVMAGWMNSQGHRENILNRNYTGIGVGYYENANGVKYWVQIFTY